MLKITALVGGSNHEVVWDDDGEVSGSTEALEMIEAFDGKVVITPTGPEVSVSIEDPHSVLAFLRDFADHVEVDGEMPDWPYEDLPSGAIA